MSSALQSQSASPLHFSLKRHIQERSIIATSKTIRIPILFLHRLFSYLQYSNLYIWGTKRRRHTVIGNYSPRYDSRTVFSPSSPSTRFQKAGSFTKPSCNYKTLQHGNAQYSFCGLRTVPPKWNAPNGRPFVNNRQIILAAYCFVSSLCNASPFVSIVLRIKEQRYLYCWRSLSYPLILFHGSSPLHLDNFSLVAPRLYHYHLQAWIRTLLSMGCLSWSRTNLSSFTEKESSSPPHRDSHDRPVS